MASNPKQKIIVTGRPDLCISGFEFLPDLHSRTTGLLLAAPSELGLSAKNTVYRVSFESSAVREIGEIPASASPGKNGTYVNILQDGGSIYQTIYTVRQDRVEISSESLELVIDGTVCLAPATNVRTIEAADGGDCPKMVIASFSNPICIAHNGGESRSAPRSACAALEQPNQDGKP
jgi:hypothetical protein